MRAAATVMLFFVFAAAAFAQDLPEKPHPAARAATPIGRLALAPMRETGATIKDMATFKDKEFAAVAWMTLAAYGADEATTKYRWDRCAGCYERGPFLHGSHSAAGQALGYGVWNLGMLVLAHEWKGRIRNKWVRPLWTAGLVGYRIVPHALTAEHNIGGLR